MFQEVDCVIDLDVCKKGYDVEADEYVWWVEGKYGIWFGQLFDRFVSKPRPKYSDIQKNRKAHS